MSDSRTSRTLRIGNMLVAPLIKLGVPMGVKRAPMALLTVSGRNTGMPRTTPVAVIPIEEGWLLIAAFGVSDWSRNLEAAGHGSIMIRGRDIEVRARRLDPGEGGPVLRDAVSDAPRMIQRMTGPYFAAGPTSPAVDWERESIKHPTFVLTPTSG